MKIIKVLKYSPDDISDLEFIAGLDEVGRFRRTF